MSKQSTRSKSKQGQASTRPATKANGSDRNATAAPSSPVSTKPKAAAATEERKIAGTLTSKPGTTAKASASGAAKPAPTANKSIKQQRKQQKIETRLAQQRHDVRLRRTTIILAVAALMVVVGLLTGLLIHNATATAGETVYNPDYPPIDGVYCDQLEQTAYHHHVLLTIYIDGQQVSVPAGVGIAGDPSSPTCYYWLHTHDTTGIVHIEAPSGGSYTLKNFLDVWQSFANSNSSIGYPSQLASSAGWTVYIYNNGVGKKVNEDFSHIDISSNAAWHELITIMYNSPNAKPITTYSWASGY